MIERALTIKESMDKWNYIRTKDSCSPNVTTKRVERQALSRRRCFWRYDLQRGSQENGQET